MIRAGRHLLALILVGGCTGLERSTLLGEPFIHTVFQRLPMHNGSLHVYIEGDGQPFVTSGEVARDPTPRYTPMLNLLRRDPAGGIYLGRPCYFGTATSPDCHYRYWTSARYGEEVVASMARVARRSSGDRPVVLIGHSGGGTLAVLLAERLPNVVAVVTLAGNLDVAAWAAHHGYTPLDGSLDPARRPPTPAGILQLHAMGGLDTVVPQFLTLHAPIRLPPGSICQLPKFDHTCCWQRHWAAVIEAIDASISADDSSLGHVCRAF